MKNRLLQAYKQAPWRVQMQWIGLFLLALVVLAALAGLYLNINSKAAEAGRHIQYLESDIEDLNNRIAKLTTDLAETQSTDQMMARAEALGFSMINPQTAVYVKVPGYTPDDELVLASDQATLVEETPIIQSSYKASLWDWLLENIWQVPGDTTVEGGTP